jgi:hypothetical protein
MNAWAFFVHRALTGDDTQQAGVSLPILGKGKMKNVDAHLKDFCATPFRHADEAGVLPAPREFYQEKNDESALDCYTSALT